MSIAKVIEVVASSEKSFDDAVEQGVHEASKSLRGISGVKVTDFTAKVSDGKLSEYKVTMDIAFHVESEQ
jgi:flavin-binding protein dodecin